LSDDPLTGIRVVAPSTVTVGDVFGLRLKGLTEPYRVPPTCFVGYPRLAGPFNLSPRGICYLDNAATRGESRLRFEVCGAPMGSTVTGGGTRTIRVQAAAEVPIQRVDVVRDGAAVFTLSPGQREVGWAVEDEASRRAHWYYARVTREDGGLAWSSPVWAETDNGAG
jgi:hypothetical protein